MASEINICNLALGKLGAHSITSFADGVVESEQCKLQYPLIRDAVLEARDWTFATFEVPLTQVSSPADLPPEYAFAFALPLDCLLIRYCFLPSNVAAPGGAVLYQDSTSEQRQRRPPWNRFGDVCVTNQSVLWARYIRRITDTTKFTSGFIQALASRLASELAMPLTNKVELQAELLKETELKMREASGRDGSQGTPQVIQVSQLTRARY